MLRVRMANDGATLQRPFARALDDRLKPAGRSVYKELFCHRMGGHGVSKVDRFVNTAVKL
jgi:hypothetical protein